jgi:hypothetical protein
MAATATLFGSFEAGTFRITLATSLSRVELLPATGY